MPEASRMRILVVEDNTQKYNDVCEALDRLKPSNSVIYRVVTVNEAEDMIDESKWDLLVLDISMDIAKGSLGPARGGHAALGGMEIIDRMYLLDLTLPTIILTGFDYFQVVGQHEDQGEMIGLSDLEARARKKLPDSLIACIRYGSAQWRSSFEDAVLSWRSKCGH